MEDERRAKWRGLGGGLVVSLIVHGLILAALVVNFKEAKPKPEAEMVPVVLVPPPQPQNKLEKKLQDKSGPKVPEPSPEAAPEAVKAPPQPASDQPAPQNAPTPISPPIKALRPVFRFGDKDAGPEKALDGTSAQKPSQPEKSADTPLEDMRPSLAMPEIALPQSQLSGNDPGGLADAAAKTVLAPETKQPKPAQEQKPISKPKTAPERLEKGKLDEAKTLFSTRVSGDPVAMTMMGKLPRAVRASELCTTEMREQLRHADEGYRLELLPAYKLERGNVLAVARAAFRANGLWYELSFRCTVDDDATQVTGFAFKVGTTIPKSQWKARGFPAF